MGEKGKKADKPAKPGQIHAGHRARVRKRFLVTGLQGFHDHEVLELLLFYAVPRRDVNEMAHLLINRFGSLAGVLDAPEEELCAIPGVGPHVAHFLNIIPEIMVQMARQTFVEEVPVLRGPNSLAKLMSGRCPACPMGHMLLILTDALQRVLVVHPYPSLDSISAKEALTRAANSRAASVVLVERVEDCTDYPSQEKLRAILRLSNQMRMLELPLRDYYTVDFHEDHPPHSFARSGQLLPW